MIISFWSMQLQCKVFFPRIANNLSNKLLIIRIWHLFLDENSLRCWHSLRHVSLQSIARNTTRETSVSRTLMSRRTWRCDTQSITWSLIIPKQEECYVFVSCFTFTWLTDKCTHMTEEKAVRFRNCYPTKYLIYKIISLFEIVFPSVK